MKTTPVQVELHILRQDILDNDYINPEYCPITRALARAGYPNLSDHGTHIEDNKRRIICGDRSNDYCELSTTVASMYVYKNNPGKYENDPDTSILQPRDFTATITLYLPSCAN